MTRLDAAHETTIASSAGAGESVLLLGNYRPTLAVARALAPLGYRVIVTRGGGEGCSEHSRRVAECWDHPPIEDEVAFTAALAQFLARRPDVTTVFPVWEPCVLALARCHDRLPRDRVYATPAPETVIACLDKTRMLAVARDAGVPCAPFAIVDSHAALTHEAARIGFPVVVRPVSSAHPIGGQKALIAETATRLEAKLPSWPSEQERLIVQAYVTGPRNNLYFAADHGRPIRFLATETLRTHVADGTGLAVDARTIALSPTLRDCGERLIAALGYHGVGCLQVLGGEERMSFLELNPRVGANHAITEASALELSRLAIDLARPSPRHEPLVIRGAGWRCAWTYGELRAAKLAIAEGEIGPLGALRAVGRAVATGMRANVHLTWDWRDPLPTLALYARRAPGLARLLRLRSNRMLAAGYPAEQR